MDKMRKRTINHEEAPHLQTTELLKPLAGIAKDDYKRAPLLGLLPCLFSIALDCFSCHTEKDQRRENPWLQDLLDQLVRCEPLPTDELVNNDGARVNKIDIIPMMEQIVLSKIPAKTPTLEAILTNYSGLFGSHRAKETWEVTRLCLQANADVFLIQKSSISTGGHDLAERNRFLRALLINMTQDCLNITADNSVGANEPYDTIATVPRLLAKAFSSARDLLGFMGLWREQLLQTSQMTQRKVEVDYVSKLSVWEDDRLIETVKDLLRPALTTAQMITLLENSHSILNSSNTNHEVWAGSVIVGCLIWGCSGETTNPELRNAVQSVYIKILLLIRGASHRSGQWRLWRVAAAILGRCPGLIDSVVLDDLLDRAFLLLGRATQLQGVNDFINHDEALHAFRFATTISHHENTFSFELGSKRSNAVQIILDSLESFGNAARAGDMAETECSSILGWDGTTETVRSREVLVLGCVAEILYSPNTLRLTLLSVSKSNGSILTFD